MRSAAAIDLKAQRGSVVRFPANRTAKSSKAGTCINAFVMPSKTERAAREKQVASTVERSGGTAD
jgi:hypothetical protein